MNLRLLALGPLCFVLVAGSSAVGQKSSARVRRIILSTQHLGAHGMGYNTQSLWQLSKRLTPADIPVLISLASGDGDIRVGAQFALASQCGAAVGPISDAVADNTHFREFSADDTLQLISDFEGCSPEVRQRATAARDDVHRQIEAEHERIQKESKQKAENEGRIQANGLKLLNPEQAKNLTREERLEIYHRSLAAMGIKEDEPMTPQQKELADRMYRSMVLGEVTTPPNF